LALVKLDPAENTPLLAPLLDIPLSSERAPALAPEELRRRQLASLTNFVIAGARTQPVVIALEDVHWADPTTLDFIRGIVERGALAPLASSHHRPARVPAELGNSITSRHDLSRAA
jgi:predicted ATPase